MTFRSTTIDSVSKPLAGVVVLVLTIGACELINGSHDGVVTSSSIDVENRTDDDLYVLALTENALSRMRIASEFSVDPDEPGFMAPGASQNLPFDVIAPDLESKDTIVFILYTPRDPQAEDHQFRLVGMLSLDLHELKRLSYRVPISPGDFRSDHLFGDAYEILSGDDETPPEAYAPAIIEGDLHLWVSFGGCREGTFTLSHQASSRGILLSLFHDYPDLEVDCDRLNYLELMIDLPDRIADASRVLLLNPNTGANPYENAFVVKM